MNREQKILRNMTEGPIVKPLVSFTIPLVWGNIFQLVYNATDSAIVGRFIGEDALAAVGTSTPLMNLAVLMISGGCMGASILMSSQYGSKDYDALNRQLSTTLWGGIFCSICCSFLMFFSAGWILRIIQVPESVLGDAKQYLQVIYLGLVFTFIYNYLANSLRALGDSKTPLLFLIISAIVNVMGDMFLVVILNKGVLGSAISTVISEGICCLCCAIYIFARVPMLRLGKKWFVFDRRLIKKTLAYGSTSAIQMAALQVGKIIIQLIVNTNGVNVIAAFAAVNRIDDFAFIPQQNIGHAMTTFLSQNRGAGKVDRIKKGFLCGMMLEAIYSVLLFFAFFFNSKGIMHIFVSKDATEVIHYGIEYLHFISFLYILPGITNGLQGFFRGLGDLKVTLLSTTTNMGVRIITLCLYMRFATFSFGGLVFSYAIGWIGMMFIQIPLLIKSLKEFEKGSVL